jgi:hypothetical protein
MPHGRRTQTAQQAKVEETTVSGDQDATRATANDDARNSSCRSPPDMLEHTPHGEA